MRVLAAMLLTMVLLSVYLNSSRGQARLSKLLFNDLSKQIGTPVSGNLSFSLPDWIKIEDLLIIDQQADTLLYAGQAKLDVALFKLFKNQLLIEQIRLEDVLTKINKEEDIFNFDYIIDAFASAEDAVDEEPLQITLDQIRLKNLKAEYKEEKIGQLFELTLGEFKSGFRLLDLNNDIYDLKDILLKKLDIKGVLGQMQADSSEPFGLSDIRLQKFVADDVSWDLDLGEYITRSDQANLKISFGTMALPQNELTIHAIQSSIADLMFKNTNAKSGPEGEINFDDLRLSGIKLLAQDLYYNDSLLRGSVIDFQFAEQSGLKLKQLSGKAELRNNRLLLDQLTARLSDSHIKADIKADLNTQDYSKSRFEAGVDELKIALSDALYFDQSLKKNDYFQSLQKDFIQGAGRFSGTLEEVDVQYLDLISTNDTRLNLSGKIFNQKLLGFDLNVNNLNLAERDLNKFVNSNELPVEIPKNIRLNGNLSGNLDDLKAKLNLNTGQGGGVLDLTLKNTSRNPIYDGEVIINQYHLGQLLKNEELGRMSGGLKFGGSGFDNPDVSFKGFVNEIYYQNEILKGIAFEGDFKDKIAKLKGGVEDAFAELNFDLIADLSGEEPKITGKTGVNKIDLKALGLMEETVVIAGDLDIDQLVIDEKRPYIDITGKNIKVLKDSLSYEVGNLSLFTSYGEEHKSLYLFTDFADISLSGNFEYDQLKDIIVGEVDKYFEIPDFVPVADSLDYYFDINGVVNYHPVITAFVPEILDFETITLESNLNSSQAVSFRGDMEIPFLLYDSIQVHNTGFDFKGDGRKLDYNLLTEQISNESFRLRKASLIGGLSENKADFNLAVRDTFGQEIHTLAGYLNSDGKNIKISFDETGTMIFYQDWGGNPYGFIEYSDQGLRFSDIVFSTSNQILRINNINENPNSPLMIFARNLDLNFFSKAIFQDSTLLAGTLKVDLVVDNYLGDQPMSFDGLAVINDLVYEQIDLGQLSLKAENTEKDKITLLASVFGENINMEASGAYLTKGDYPLDFKITVDAFDPIIITAFLDDLIYDISGNMTGEVLVKGSMEKPDINGALFMDRGSFKILETAALLSIENQALRLENSKINFDNFIIKDIHNQDLTLNGEVSLTGLPHITYDIDMQSDNFMIADSEFGQSELFFGQAFLKSNLKFKGVNTTFKLTGDIHALEPTNLTLLLPEEDFGEDLSAVITFVEFNNPEKSKTPKEESGVSFANALNVNVFADEKSVVNMLMDPITGDMLSGRGNINLNVGFDNAGDLFMVGSLDIKKGSYDLTFQTINKHFEINEQSNSSVTFTGDPLKGQLNVTAEYRVPGKKDIILYPELKDKLKEKDINTNKLLTDLRVDLVLTGEVMSPDVEFQVVVKKDEIIEVNLQQALSEVGITLMDDKGVKSETAGGGASTAFQEVLKQNAIMLLIANNFTASQIFESFTSSTGAGYEDLARRNASQLISSQLEKYASEWIKGVDVNLGLESSGGLAETGSDRSTNINLGVSKGLANNRLVVSVGKNFELENKDRKSDEFIDNVEADWLITPEGRYRLRVFRKTQNQTAVEGSVIETGLGFIIAIDYESWLDLIRKKQ